MCKIDYNSHLVRNTYDVSRRFITSKMSYLVVLFIDNRHELFSVCEFDNRHELFSVCEFVYLFVNLSNIDLD